MCIDINECVENPSICNVGECINEPGKYYCRCPEGYMPLPGRRKYQKLKQEFFFAFQLHKRINIM